MNNFVKDNVENVAIGNQGEQRVRDLLKKNRVRFMQIDLMAYENNKYVLIEVKRQELFTAPPFDGHGMPKFQLGERTIFEARTGIKTILYVDCITSGNLYKAYLMDLNDIKENGKWMVDWYATSGVGRVIFPLSAFTIV